MILMNKPHLNAISSLIFIYLLCHTVIIASTNEKSFHPEEFVNLLSGTFSSDQYSTGNTLPLVGE